MSFTDSEIIEINKVTDLFPKGTELSVAKIIDKTPFYYGTLNSGTGVLTPALMLPELILTP